MGYLYKIPYDLIPNKSLYSHEYLPIKKKIDVSNIATISIYHKSEDYEGICGFAKIIGQPRRSSELTGGKEIKLFDRNMFQLPISMLAHARFAIIPKKYLFHFPSLNRKPKVQPFNDCVLYWDNGLSYEIEYLSFKFPYSEIFPTPPEKEFGLKVHVLRELALHSRFYRQIAAKAELCSICFYPNPQVDNLFELHEIDAIDFDKPFVPISSKNFIVVCPTCHKLEHKRMLLD